MSDIVSGEVAASAIVALPMAAGDALASHARLFRDLALYGLCSALALGVDWSTLTLLVWHGVGPVVAAAIGFSLGMIVTYVASITLVYADRRHGSPVREALVFAGIGLAGLGLSELLIFIFATRLGLAAPVAKAPTAVVVFLFNFALRRALLFAGLAA